MQVKEAVDYVTGRMTLRVDDRTCGYSIGDYVAALCDEEKGLPDKFGPDFTVRYAAACGQCAIASYTSEELIKQGCHTDYSVMLAANGSCAYTDFHAHSVAVTLFNADGAVTYYSDLCGEEPVDFNLNIWLNGRIGKEDGHWSSTLAGTYEQLEFDKIVNWSRWLKINMTFPKQYCLTASDME